MQELAERRDLPTGTVTFLRTDVESSMALARTAGADWDALNATHIGLIRGAIDAHGGVLVRTEGDAIFAVFTDAGAAVAAAIDAQRLIGAHAWPPGAAIRVRMALHSGEAHRAGDDYGGFEVNRAARIAGAGHGGQIILSRRPPGHSPSMRCRTACWSATWGSMRSRTFPARNGCSSWMSPACARSSLPCAPPGPPWATSRCR